MSILLKVKPSLARRIEKFNKHHVFHENSVTHCRDYLIKMMQSQRASVCAIQRGETGEAQKTGGCRHHERRRPEGKRFHGNRVPSVNEPDKVSQATRNRVEQAALEVGYLPQSLGRNMKRNESRTILVIVPDICDPFLEVSAVLKSLPPSTAIWC
jgi:LacI family repressor for deo operon, udp, cdd, tsx, nupC, and nupG